MRCPRCGNENPEQNRFCGMCGTTLLAPAPIAPKPQPVAVAPVAPRPEPAPPRPPEPVRAAPPPVPRREQHVSISGPSFLGLNDAAPSRVSGSNRATLSTDPDSAPPDSNLHYLLEDEEEHRGSGLWKFVLILIALALAIGFGYLRWKNQGLGSLIPPAKKPATTDQPTTGDGSGPPANPTPTPPAQAPASSSITPEPQQSPTPQGNANPANSSAAPATTPSGSPAAAVPASTPSSPANNANPPDGGSASADTKASSDKSSSDTASDDSSADESAEEPAAAAPKPRAEPAAKPRAAILADPVIEARKYLYGKGAAQDCEHGLRLLKPAANSGNAKAMIEMGALYSAGLCTPHDLPTAYRWFATALRKEPDNQSVQSDLQKLWGEMTQPERQLAIKLSQ